MLGNNELQIKLVEGLSILKELHQLSLEKKDAVLKDEIELLEKIVLKEEALTDKFKKIDDACSPQVQFFLSGKTTDLPGAITDLLKEIKEVALKLKTNNRLNLELIQDSLAITQFTVNSLLSLEEMEAGVYGASGKIESNQKKNVFLDYKG